ncbi:alanine racemase [Streptomyces sp. JNUCC 64]
MQLPPPPSRPAQTWREPARFWGAVDAASAHLDPPFGVVHLGALAHNAHDLLRRANGTPIRVASKSLRVRGALEAVLALEGFRGVLAFTLAEAIWLARKGIDDIVVGYPTVHRRDLSTLAADEHLARTVTLMIDDTRQLEVLDAVAPPRHRARIRVAIDLDASLRTAVGGHVGVRRSPLRTPASVEALAREIVSRPGLSLVGLMSYEAQIAGVPDAGPARSVMRLIKRLSAAELRGRRTMAVARLREIAADSGHVIEFVNGGGTGSIESTRTDPSITEIAAGSGLFAPHLFDRYRSFSPAPAAAFAISVTRRPDRGVATLLGGGWIASGRQGGDRLPRPVWPPDLRLTRIEGAGEVQTPIRGRPAAQLRIGERVWLRHAKAGELAEHLDGIHLIDGDEVIGDVPTYRGEGKTFL